MKHIQTSGEINVHNEVNDTEPIEHFANDDQFGPAYKYTTGGNIRRKRSLPHPSPKKYTNNGYGLKYQISYCIVQIPYLLIYFLSEKHVD